MKKTMLTLIALLVMSVQFAGAQNYEVVYRTYLDLEVSSQLYDHFKDVKGASLESIVKDMNEAELYTTTNTSYDRFYSQILSEKSKLLIHVGDTIFDTRNILSVSNPTLYIDYSTKEYFMELDIYDKPLITKFDMSLIESEVFTHAEGTKNILGHECKKMTSNMGRTLWYAVDIPFETKVYENVPGLVLETEMNGMGKMVAVSITPNNKKIKMPEDVSQKFSAEQVKEMYDKGLKLKK